MITISTKCTPNSGTKFSCSSLSVSKLSYSVAKRKVVVVKAENDIQAKLQSAASSINKQLDNIAEQAVGSEDAQKKQYVKIGIGVLGGLIALSLLRTFFKFALLIGIVGGGGYYLYQYSQQQNKGEIGGGASGQDPIDKVNDLIDKYKK